jgi:hypothetical protein
MSYRDDFNSSMTNPGTYSSNSTYGAPGYSGNYGGTNNPGAAFTTIAQANLAAQNGGQFPAGGFPSSMTPQAQSLLGKLYADVPDYTTGPIQPALGPQGVPTSFVPPRQALGYPPSTTLQQRLNAMNLYRNPFRWPNQAMANGKPQPTNFGGNQPDYTYPGYGGNDPNGMGRAPIGNYPASGGFGINYGGGYPGTTKDEVTVSNAGMYNNPKYGW